MLKKLVKYGNSNALVLDKALLELLNIPEGSLVKIKTDGTSLIITPHTKELHGDISHTIVPYEILNEAIKTKFIQTAADPIQSTKYLDEMRMINERYIEASKKLQNPEFEKAYKKLAKKFEGTFGDPEFSRLNYELMCKYMPEYAQMDNDIKEINSRYPSVAINDIQSEEKDDNIYFESKKVHEKYVYLQPELIKLHENPDYINDMVILSEKYLTTKNSSEYLNEYTHLISKYMPDHAEFIEELHALGLVLITTN